VCVICEQYLTRVVLVKLVEMKQNDEVKLSTISGSLRLKNLLSFNSVDAVQSAQEDCGYA